MATRWKVQAAIVARVANEDPAFDPIAYVAGTIAQMAAAAGYDVSLVAPPSARRYYEAGDIILWPRPQANESTRPEYGYVVVEAGQYMVCYADGHRIPLPVSEQP